MIAPYRNGQAEMQPVIYEGGPGDPSLADNGRFTVMLEQAIERSLSLPGNPAVDIFTQIIENLRPRQEPTGSGSQSGQSTTPLSPNQSTQIQHDSSNTSNMAMETSSASPLCLCAKNTTVSKSFYQHAPLPRACPPDFLIVGFKRNPSDQELLIVGVHPETQMTSTSDDSFNGLCFGCGDRLSSYGAFCGHFLMEKRPRGEVFKFYCMQRGDGTIDQTITIPFQPATQGITASPTAVVPSVAQTTQGPMIIIPEQLQEKLVFLNCLTDGPLSMEGNYQQILESDFLERCFKAQQGSPGSRSVLSRECMIVLLCLELSRLEPGRLIWSEQLDYTFNKARSEIQRQMDRDSGIFPKMFMDIARLLAVTTKSIQLVRSDLSMGDAITSAWKHLLTKHSSNRPRFIVCIYDGSPPAQFLVIARERHLVRALEQRQNVEKVERSALERLCSVIQSRLPQSTQLPHHKKESPQPQQQHHHQPRRQQDKFADDYCLSMIEQELTQTTVAKTLQTFSDRCPQLDQFKSVRTMLIINDSSFAEAKRQLNDNEEIYGLEVFTNAIRGILEEINSKRSTLWLFCFLGISHSSYNQAFYRDVLPLLEHDHALSFFMSYRPYDHFCSGSPLSSPGNMTQVESIGILSEYEYGTPSHFSSLSSTTPTVISSDSFDQLVNLYMADEQVQLDTDTVKLTTLIEHCYVSAFHHIESESETLLADYATFDLVNRVISNHQPAVIRTETSEKGQIAYSLLSGALQRHSTSKVRLGVVLYDPAESRPFVLSETTRELIGKPEEWSPLNLGDFSGCPVLIVYAGEVIEFNLFSSPLFSSIDMRLIMNGYFTRRRLEAEFLMATSYNKQRGMGQRSSAEWQAIQALQGLGSLQGKRKGEPEEVDESERKRVKVEEDSDTRSYAPTKVILSSEAYALFRDSVDLNYTGILPGRHCRWSKDRHFNLSRGDSLEELVSYYRLNCESTLEPGSGEPGKRFLVSLSHCVRQTSVAREIAREIEQRIRSQFTVEVLDETEIDLVPIISQPNLSLTRRDQLFYSAIINSIPRDQLATYAHKRDEYRERSVESINVELSHLSMVTCRSRRTNRDSPHAVWPLALNIPQLSDGNIQVEMIIPNEKRNCFVFDSNGLRSLRLKQQDLNERDQNMKLLCKTIIVSFGIGGATKGHYDLTKAMDGTDYAHIVVVKHCDKNEYQDYLPSSCLLVMHPDFDQYGIGCMKLFAQRLLQHSWALSPNECWPFCFFLDDDVTQFKKWNLNQRQWDDISLYQLLIELEQKITIDIAMVGFRGWNRHGLEDHCSDTSKRLVTGSYLLNLNNDVLVDHTKYEAEDIDFSLRQFCAGNTCLIFERISVIRKKEEPRQIHLPISANIDDYIVPLHTPHGVEPKPKIDVPGFYLLDRYLKAKARELFEVAHKENLPVLQTGRYQNLTHHINVEFWTDSSRGRELYGGLILLTVPGHSRANAFPTDRELEEINFAPNARLLIIANDSNTIRNVLAVHPSIEDKWEVRFSNERQTNSPMSMVLLTGVRKQSFYPSKNP